MKILLLTGISLFFLFSVLFAQSSHSETCIIQHPSNDRYGSYSPTGDSIVFESDRSGEWDVYIFDVITGETHSIYSDLPQKRRPSWSPDGNRIVTGCSDGTVKVWLQAAGFLSGK